MEQQDGEDHADVQEKLLTQISKVFLKAGGLEADGAKVLNVFANEGLVLAQAIDLSEEKVAMAQQMYDYVDNRIREFDKNMQSFDAELMAERARLGISVCPLLLGL